MAKAQKMHPETMVSAESGRPMVRGEKLRSIKVGGQSFSYLQPGWWCSLTDPDDMEGQLVGDDNKVADMARRTAKAIVAGETVFVPVVIRAIRESLGLTQREAGQLFQVGDKAFEKYEAGEIAPSGPTRKLLEIAVMHPKLLAKSAPKIEDWELRDMVLSSAKLDTFSAMFSKAGRPVDVTPTAPRRRIAARPSKRKAAGAPHGHRPRP